MIIMIDVIRRRPAAHRQIPGSPAARRRIPQPIMCYIVAVMC